MVIRVFNMYVKLILLFSILSNIINVDDKQFTAIRYIKQFRVGDIAHIHHNCYLAIFLSIQEEFYKDYGYTFKQFHCYIDFFLRFNNGTLEDTEKIFGPLIWSFISTMHDGRNPSNIIQYEKSIKQSASSIIENIRRTKYSSWLEPFYENSASGYEIVNKNTVNNMIQFCDNIKNVVSETSNNTLYYVGKFLNEGSLNENLNKYLLLKKYGGFSYLLKTDKFLLNKMDEVLTGIFNGINHVIYSLRNLNSLVSDYSVSDTQLSCITKSMFSCWIKKLGTQLVLVNNYEQLDILLAIQYIYNTAIRLKEMIKQLMDEIYGKDAYKKDKDFMDDFMKRYRFGYKKFPADESKIENDIY